MAKDKRTSVKWSTLDRLVDTIVDLKIQNEKQIDEIARLRILLSLPIRGLRGKRKNVSQA